MNESFSELVALLRRAADAYYNSETVLMPDAEYDVLLARLAAMKAEDPTLNDGGLLDRVAGGVGVGDVRHPSPMLSLGKVKEEDALSGFLASLPADARTVVEPKMDGLAVRGTYLRGVLTQVVTRGDGYAGEDVTAQAGSITGLPRRLCRPMDLEVRGEAHMTDVDFEIASQNRVAVGKTAFANPRNAMAGALRAKDREYDAPMHFACYEAEYEGADDSYVTRMAHVRELGITPAMDLVDVGSLAPLEAVRKIGRLRPMLGFPIDGAVVKIDSTRVRQQVGMTSSAPRWAIAYKFPADTAVTKLLDIELAIGRTGRLSLTGILEPVSVGGTVISRATLHHPQFVLDADLRIGDDVWVYRAGDVIPRVTTPVLANRPDGLPQWSPPDVCPQCGEPLDKTGLLWRCHTPECSVAGRIRYAADRDVLDIDGLDEAVADALAESGLANNVADLFELTREQLANLRIGNQGSGASRLLGQKMADRILAGIEKARTQPLHRVITALGVRNVGRSMGRRLAERFRTMEALCQASSMELASVAGIGIVKASTIGVGLDEMAPVIHRLAAAGLQMTAAEAQAGASDLPLAGKKVCVTGVVPGLTRSEADAVIHALGGTAVHSVSKATDLVVIGDAAGGKADKARELGLPVMNAQDFAALHASLR